MLVNPSWCNFYRWSTCNRHRLTTNSPGSSVNRLGFLANNRAVGSHALHTMPQHSLMHLMASSAFLPGKMQALHAQTRLPLNRNAMTSALHPCH